MPCHCLFPEAVLLSAASHHRPKAPSSHNPITQAPPLGSDTSKPPIFYDGPNDFNNVPYRHLYAQIILLHSSTNHFLFFIF